MALLNVVNRFARIFVLHLDSMHKTVNFYNHRSINDGLMLRVNIEHVFYSQKLYSLDFNFVVQRVSFHRAVEKNR